MEEKNDLSERANTGSIAYIGTFHYDGSGGIHICRFDGKNGSLTHLKTVSKELNAGNLCISGQYLHCTDETENGSVHTFRIDPLTGDISEIAQTQSMAVNPSHITVTEDRRYAIVTHFSVGPSVRRIKKAEGLIKSVRYCNDSATCLYRLSGDGRIGDLLDVQTHEVTGIPMTMIHKAYQRPGQNLFAENDLGQDRIYFFTIENDRFCRISSLEVSAGGGPRHGVFHPSLPYLYINFEHRPAVLRVDFEDIQNPHVAEECCLYSEEALLEEDNQSEIFLSRDGSRLYTFMRGKGLAYVLDVEEKSGALSMRQRFELPGKDPRGVFFAPDHRHILVAGHNSDAVYTLNVGEDGMLAYSEVKCAMERPASIAFYEQGSADAG